MTECYLTRRVRQLRDPRELRGGLLKLESPHHANRTIEFRRERCVERFCTRHLALPRRFRRVFLFAATESHRNEQHREGETERETHVFAKAKATAKIGEVQSEGHAPSIRPDAAFVGANPSGKNFVGAHFSRRSATYGSVRFAAAIRASFDAISIAPLPARANRGIAAYGWTSAR